MRRNVGQQTLPASMLVKLTNPGWPHGVVDAKRVEPEYWQPELPGRQTTANLLAILAWVPANG